MLAGCGEGPLQSPEKASETGAGWMSWEGEGSETSEVGEGHNVGSFVHQGAWTLFKGWGIVHRKTTIKEGRAGKILLQYLDKRWWWLYPRWQWSQQDLLMNWILGGRDEKSKGMPGFMNSG